MSAIFFAANGLVRLSSESVLGKVMKEQLRKLKNQIEAEIPSAFVDEDKVCAPQGWPTGIKKVDEYLIWKGIPKGSLTLLTGKRGQGATSAWVEAAMNVVSQGKWVAWVSNEAQLFPISLKQRNINLNKLLIVEAPKESEKLLWLLQELMSSTIFDLIGCDLEEIKLREHQLQKLKTQARTVQTSVVLLSENSKLRKSSLYSLILNFKRNEILIERALHRPTPQSISRRLSYVQFTRYTAKPIKIGLIKSNALPDPAAPEQDSRDQT